MPWINYVRLQDAGPLVDAVNNAETDREHDIARAFLHGYKKRCEQEGLTWPCIDLDLRLPDDGRPAICGEYLDWEPESER